MKGEVFSQNGAAWKYIFEGLEGEKEKENCGDCCPTVSGENSQTGRIAREAVDPFFPRKRSSFMPDTNRGNSKSDSTGKRECCDSLGGRKLKGETICCC